MSVERSRASYVPDGAKEAKHDVVSPLQLKVDHVGTEEFSARILRLSNADELRLKVQPVNIVAVLSTENVRMLTRPAGDIQNDPSFRMSSLEQSSNPSTLLGVVLELLINQIAQLCRLREHGNAQVEVWFTPDRTTAPNAFCWAVARRGPMRITSRRFTNLAQPGAARRSEVPGPSQATSFTACRSSRAAPSGAARPEPSLLSAVGLVP